MKKDIIPDNLYGLHYMHYCDVLSNYVHWFKQKPTAAILQYHHIKPKKLYPTLAKCRYNLVYVTPTLHMFLHFLLWAAFKEDGNTELASKYNVMKNILTYTNDTTGFNCVDSSKKHTLKMTKELMQQICKQYKQAFSELDNLSVILERSSESNSVDIGRYINRNGFVSAIQRRVKAGKMTVDKQHELLELLNQVQDYMCGLYNIEQSFVPELHR